MSLYLGLNIGIASVGYAVLNDDGDPITAGVRLFTSGDSTTNENRRNSRHLRRTIRRKHHRLVRADRLFVATGLAEYIEGTKVLDLRCDGDLTPYHLRVKGLREPLADKELVIALRHLLKHRGSSPINASEQALDDAELDKDTGSSLSTKALIAKTKAELNAGRFICEIQLDRLENPEIAHVRGAENRFLCSDYAKEARQILATQKEFNPAITDAFCDAYMRLLETRRAYYEGPDCDQSPYGWQDEEEWMNRLFGNCTYTGETRIVKRSPSAELFNLLNDLNNMQINGAHITYEEKVDLVNGLFRIQKSSPTVKKVLSFLDKDKNATVTGLRVNAAGKQIFTELQGYHYIKAAAEHSGCNIDLNDLDITDEIAKILTIFQDEKNATEKLQALNLDPAFVYDLTAIYRDAKASIFKGTHSLSRTAIHMVLDDLWHQPKNQMQLFTEKGIKPKHTNLFIKNGRIMPEIVQNMALSAVARRSVSQAFTVFNELMELFPEGFAHITTELFREDNGPATKKKLKNRIAENEKLNNRVREILDSRDVRGGVFEKVRLYLIQEGKDIYTGEDLDLDKVISDATYAEVNHIIPMSISFDNSISNKVLTRRENVWSKGLQTPYQWMQHEGAPDFDAFTQRILAHKTDDAKDSSGGKSADKRKLNKKESNLLCLDDINKWKVRAGYINRNLVDVQTAACAVADALRECTKNSDAVVKTINSTFTRYLKTLWGLNRDVDESFHAHFAVDACVIAAAPLVWNQLSIIRDYDLVEQDGDSYVVDKKTGEIIDDEENLKSALAQYRKAAANYMSFPVRYSHKVDKKENRSLAKDTLISVRVRPSDGKEWKLDKFNLYDPSLTVSKLDELFVKEPDKLLVYEGDHKTYLILRNIYDTYKSRCEGKNTNPFAIYYAEHGPVKKHSKSGNGPVIKTLKYYNSALNGNPFDISHKQGCKPGKRVILNNQTTFRIDVYKAKKGYRIVRVSVPMTLNTPESMALLERERASQKHSDHDKFLFSLFKNDIVEIDGKYYVYRGFDGGNRIAVQYLDRNLLSPSGALDPMSISISSRTSSCSKVTVGALGRPAL